jgi:hypothetical protein
MKRVMIVALWKMLAFLAALARGMPVATYPELVLKCLLIMQLG